MHMPMVREVFGRWRKELAARMTFAMTEATSENVQGSAIAMPGLPEPRKTALAAVLTYWLVRAAEAAPIHPTATTAKP
jgi:hypothetical protein